MEVNPELNPSHLLIFHNKVDKKNPKQSDAEAFEKP